MKTIIKTAIFSTLVLFLSACEKVIEVDLEEAQSQVVIEANLQAEDNIITVNISNTAPYFESGNTNKIENATVSLINSANETISLNHIENGEYNASITPIYGAEYTLRVVYNGETYEANSILPNQVQIDSAFSQYQEAFGPSEAGYQVFLRYSDPANENNYYRLRHYLNNELQNTTADLQMLNDNFNDGNRVQTQLFLKTFDPGDVVNVELIHFDESSYDYFSSLSDIVGSNNGPNSGSAAPGNPISNWTNNALGYFSCSTSSFYSVVVEE